MQLIPSTVPPLTVKDEGGTVVGAATALNFTGAGVTVTNEGGGQAKAQISGGGGGGGIVGPGTSTVGAPVVWDSTDGSSVANSTPTGTGNPVLDNGPTLVNPVVGTQTQGDNSTKAASTAYVDTALAGVVQVLAGEVATFADLPSAAANSGKNYLVRQSTGVYFVNRKVAGIYTSDGAAWNLDGDATEAYFQDTLAWSNITSKPSTFTPSAHASTHENGGADEISVAGLSGLLADPQTPTTHAASHAAAGSDPLTLSASQVGLGNVTNDTQTKAAVVPNTLPNAGQLLLGNAGGTAYGVISMSGDATIASTGALTIAAQAVTYAKLQNVSATSRILLRKTAGAGSVEEGTLSELLDFVGSAAQGDILYRNASGWVRLAAGTSGHFLKTNGTGANPEWAAGGSSGGTKVIFRLPASTQIINNSTTETSVFGSVSSKAIAGGTLGTAGVVRFIVAGTITNSSGAAVTITPKVLFGGTSYFQDTTATIASNANPRAFKIEGELVADNATNAQRLTGRITIGPAGTVTTGYGDLGSASGVIADNNFGGTPTQDSTVDKDFDITITASANTFAVTVNVAVVYSV